MDLRELMKKNREKEMAETMRFVTEASLLECAQIIDLIRVAHGNLIAFDPEHRTLKGVESLSINGESVQLNLEGSKELFDELEGKCSECGCDVEEE